MARRKKSKKRQQEVVNQHGGGKKQRQRKRNNFNYTIKQKIAMVREAYSKPKYVNEFCRESGLANPSLLRKWKFAIGKLQQKALVNPHARSCHKGRKVDDLPFELEMKDWVMEQRSMDIAVRTKDIINHVLRVSPTFKDGSRTKLIAWVYKFLVRHGLSVRRVTRIGQKLSGHLKKVQDDCSEAMRNRMAVGGTLHGMPLKYFINMDQTAVYFEMKSSTTVHKKGERTVSVRDSASNSKRATVVLAVAADGTKLPPFVVFKGKCHSFDFIC
jgi:transposase-like protein